jgi:ubiquinone/menaquinone biosynthesis C-methylase UbiE
MPRIFDIGNERLNRLVYEMLMPQPGDHILDLGGGTGKLVHKIAGRADSCCVEGLDFSEAMVAIARRRNRDHISKAKAVIHMGDVDRMPFQADSFTKICSVNTIYFWFDRQSTARRILRRLVPGGMLFLGFEDRSQMDQRPLDADVFRIFEAAEAATILMNTGLVRSVATRPIAKGSSVFHCTVATGHERPV